jgi:hypothetical protein
MYPCLLACLQQLPFPLGIFWVGLLGCFPPAENWDVGLQAPCTCVGLGRNPGPNLVCAGTDDRRIFSENLGSLSKKRKGRVGFRLGGFRLGGFRLGGLRQMGFADPTSRGQNRSPGRDLEASKGSSPRSCSPQDVIHILYVLTLIVLQLYICSCYTPLSAGAECFFCFAELETATLRRMRKVFWEWRTHGSRDAFGKSTRRNSLSSPPHAES